MDSLDLTRLLFGHLALTLGAAISVSPAYNLPTILFGLASCNSANDGVRQFALILIATGVLDILWLISGWKDQSSGLSMTLVIANLILKPVTLLAALGSLRSRGESISLPGGLGGFSSGGRPSWNNSNSNSNNMSSYQASYQGDEEQATAPIRKASAPTAPAVAPASSGEGYHTLE